MPGPDFGGKAADDDLGESPPPTAAVRTPYIGAGGFLYDRHLGTIHNRLFGKPIRRSSMKKTLQRLFPRVATNTKLVLNKRSYLHTTGWFESVRRGFPCDVSGEPLPWMNYSIIAVLNDRLTADMALFEYGSGYSTMFYARRVRSVTSVEHVEEWRDQMADRLPANARVMFREPDTDGEYCRAILSTEGLYDVIVVDGRDRVNCVKRAMERLSPTGVLLLDDSQRTRYSDALTHARKGGFRSIAFQGLKPAGKALDETTIFYRDGNCLSI